MVRRFRPRTLGLAVCLALLGAPAVAATPVHAAPGSPNIVLILTDDQRWDELSWMPQVHSKLVQNGVTFRHAFALNPLCCPSRSTILTGLDSS